MKIEWIKHLGKKILIIDYSNIKSQEEMLSLLEEGGELILSQPGKVRVLIDMTEASVGPDFMKEAKAQGKTLLHKYEKSAILGISGLKAMLLKGYNLFSGDTLQPFASKEDALKHLSS